MRGRTEKVRGGMRHQNEWILLEAEQAFKRPCDEFKISFCYRDSPVFMRNF